MPKFNSKRLLIALIVGIVVLNILLPVQGLTEYWLNVNVDMPNEVVVEKNIGIWMMLRSLVAIIFEVMLPMLIYAFIIEKMIQKSTLVLGLVFGLVIFFAGSLPQYFTLPLLIKVSFNFSFIRAFWSLFNLVLIGGIIGGIYRPVGQEKIQSPQTLEDQSSI
jgi:hypothetical protein